LVPLPLAVIVCGATLSSCGGSASAASSSAPSPAEAPRPIAGDVERTTFAPSLGVHLDSMSRRASGLYVQDVKTGTGNFAAVGRTVVVRYEGWLPSGKQFDASEITVTLGSNKTIAAWEQGLLGMRVGGERRLVVPPNLGYGSHGAGADIPPNAVLVFEMQLLSVY
ncbi:MAG TPA: FKBP-type peptidyl-prolyl cis-trans isomerase, partial [Gemmatimonadaceae bacterium]|nr:FKBP-type peptidyl-prolyl cis-trans isomerase [Gemmatimonadaceae bacterium]